MACESRIIRMVSAFLCAATFFVSDIFSASLPWRLDLYDASDNHLMFITFQYNESGLNIGREVFMSDSTFMRRVVINYDSEGRRRSEVSFNFNDDTSWIMEYRGADKRGFTIVDQFKVDQVGGAVNYSSSGGEGSDFDLTYEKTGGVASRMKYEKDAEGNLTKVTVFDQAGAMQYYGVFRNAGIGVREPKVGVGGVVWGAEVKGRGGRMVEVLLSLPRGGEVRCDLMTLSGRYAASLVRGSFGAGRHSRVIRMDGKEFRGMVGGMYVVVVSIDGETVSRSRYLHQEFNAGGVR